MDGSLKGSLAAILVMSVVILVLWAQYEDAKPTLREYALINDRIYKYPVTCRLGVAYYYGERHADINGNPISCETVRMTVHHYNMEGAKHGN